MSTYRSGRTHENNQAALGHRQLFDDRRQPNSSMCGISSDTAHYQPTSRAAQSAGTKRPSLRADGIVALMVLERNPAACSRMETEPAPRLFLAERRPLMGNIAVDFDAGRRVRSNKAIRSPFLHDPFAAIPQSSCRPPLLNFPALRTLESSPAFWLFRGPLRE